MKQLDLGDFAPDFELKTADGQVVRLSEVLTGGTAVLVFYKASCPTCQFTFPYLQRIHSEARARVIGISQDEPDETKEFIERYGITFDVVIDEHPYDTSAAYGMEYVPAVFVVGSNGSIELSDYGFSKATLTSIAGYDIFSADDGIPATRPG